MTQCESSHRSNTDETQIESQCLVLICVNLCLICGYKLLALARFRVTILPSRITSCFCEGNHAFSRQALAAYTRSGPDRRRARLRPGQETQHPAHPLR